MKAIFVVGCIGLALYLGVSLSAQAQAQARVSVTVSGDVASPGTHELTNGQRLTDAVGAAQVHPDAYMIAASWSQHSLWLPQRRKQAGLLYELEVIRQQAQAQGDHVMASTSRSLHEWLASMPITGRRIVSSLDPAELTVSDADNFPVDDGDQLIYVQRPDAVRVVGAVVHTCVLKQVGLKTTRDYLAECAPSSAADPDSLYAIQPDGQVFELGVALWNRSSPLVLAPGAIIYVPLDRRVIRAVTDDVFNREMAEFLATQTVSDALVPK